MKKLFVLSLFAVLAFSAKSFAQSSALVPYDGATQQYTFGGIKQNLSYEFIVSTSPTDWTATATGWGTFTDGAGNTVSGSGTVDASGNASVYITWASDASTTFSSGLYLYVHVYGTGASPDFICDNYKAVLVTPTGNSFALTLADATGDHQCPELTNGFQPVTADNSSGQTYRAGKTVFQYTVTRTGANNHAWSFDFDLSQSNAANFSYTVEGTNSGTILSGNQSSTLTGQTASVDSGDGSVTITITMDNVPGSKPAFTVDITNATDVTSSVDILSTNLPAAVTHNVNEMPTIGGFTGN